MTQQAHKLSARTPATVRQSLYVPPLPLLLLFLCCANVCVAWDDGMRRYIFNDMINTSGMHSVGVVREVPRKGQSGMQAYTVATQEDWKLIRIVTSTKDLENSSRYCTATDQEVMDFQGGIETCVSSEILTEEKKQILLHNTIPAAVKLHADRLLVQPMKGKLIVPRFEGGSYCNHFTVPEEHRSEGVENADFVLYVAAGQGRPFGVTCTPVEPSGRPITGAVNFPPHFHEGPRVDVRFTAHEMAHALGFDYERMKKLNMVGVIANVRGKVRDVVSSTLTIEKARKHYNCPTLPGMEFDYSSTGQVVSCWSNRNAKDELMAMRLYDSFGAGYYTAITMATFEDMGYYRANWGMEEPMSWGNHSGCSFFSDLCIVNGTTKYPDMFCSKSVDRCTSDRNALGICFLSPSIHWDKEKNDCPFAVPFNTQTAPGEFAISYCFSDDITTFSGSLMGKDSWCFDGESLNLQSTVGNVPQSVLRVCALVSCDESNRKVKVKYNGSDEYHDCPEGNSIEVKSPTFQDGGKIKCPKYTEVCTIAPNGSSLIPLVVRRPTTASASTGNQIVNAGDNHSSRTSEETETGSSAGGASAGEDGNVRTNSPSAPSDIVAQNTIDVLQNGTKPGVKFGQDGALSAVCSLPIVLLAMVLALVLPC